MMWPGFAALSSAWLFLLLGPVILFYFLKLRRPRREIPSLALWRQVISDQRVNSPFQRFKRNLLLLLQILLLCSLALAAMQPFFPSGSDHAQSIPVLIDCSASMAAVDQPGGKSRLDVAKEDVARLIDNLLPNQRLCLIAVDATARRLTDFTDNQRVLHDALRQLAVRPVPSRLEDGLRMAQALARTADVQTVVFLSDGNVPAAIEFALPFKLNYQRLPAAGPNVGITDFNARRTKSGWDVFARLEGSAKPAASDAESSTEDRGLVEVELLQNGEPLKRESVGVTGGKASRVAFQIDTAAAASLELRLRPDGFDALASDNAAFLELPASRNLVVYCSDELASYRHSLEAMSDIDLYPRSGAPEPELVDLKITDSTVGAGPRGRVTLHVGVVPTDVQPLVGIEEQLVEVVDWNRTAPLLRHVQLLDVQIADDPVSKPGIGERDYELAGYEILAQGSRGPLILEKPSETGLDCYLLFHTDRSSLPYRVGFPILVSNAVQIALDRSALSEAKSWPTGNLPPQRLTAETAYVIDGPDGNRETITASPTGLVAGASASTAGRYVIRQGTDVVTSLGVSLLAPTETALAAVDKLQFPETSVATSETAISTDRPLWGWFAAAGLVLLLGEWWCFQRRPGGVPA
jgi:Ca-activated chloride channel family protein